MNTSAAPASRRDRFRASSKAAERPVRTAAMEGMEAHMKSMHEMHEKLMAAKTPEERNALMPQHLKPCRTEWP